MNKKFTGILKLTRFNEYLYFVTVTTILGIASAEGEFGWRFIIVLVANLLSVGFAFMINDVEDAPDDALNPEKVHRNPVSAGLLTPRTARLISFIVALIALAFYASLGGKAFYYGLVSLVLGVFYSAYLRLKNRAFFDLLSHCWLLAGLQTLTGFFSFSDFANEKLIFPLGFVLCVSMYGELFNELRDFEGDKRAGLKHTAIVLGEKTTHVLMLILLAIGGICGIITFLFLGLFNPWVIAFMVFLAALFLMPVIMRMKKGDSSMSIQTPLQKPLERAAAIALFLGYLVPALVKFFI
jgi:4-hydroxybenzoate polyprenyltransferase